MGRHATQLAPIQMLRPQNDLALHRGVIFSFTTASWASGQGPSRRLFRRYSRISVDHPPELRQYGLMFKRSLNIRPLLERKSLFLLGPRLTGKSTNLRENFPEAHVVDLLESGLFRDLLQSPQRLGEIVELRRKEASVFVIDEVQKIPTLLNEVHRLIEKDKKLRFILTGSSARKLRRSGVNLLGGRAAQVHFHPITFPELATERKRRRSWEDCLSIGALPSVLDSDDPVSDLRDYVGLYLREEVQAEGLTRSIEAFSRFLDVAALMCGKQLNFTAIGSDAQVPPRTVIDYFGILQDTLVGSLLPAFVKTPKRKAMTSAKFYFFDVGVAGSLLGRNAVKEGTEEYGKALEHYVFTQIKAYLDYHMIDLSLSYWRSLSKFEVDFVLPLSKSGKALKAIGIEVKATRNPGERALHGLRALAEDVALERKIVVAPVASSYQTKDGIEVLHPEDFLAVLWSGRLV